MKLQQYSLLLLLLLSFSTIVYGQEENITVDQALKQESIENQFDIVIKKSGRYQEYKVIKQVWINKLKTNKRNIEPRGKSGKNKRKPIIGNQRKGQYELFWCFGYKSGIQYSNVGNYRITFSTFRILYLQI